MAILVVDDNEQVRSVITLILAAHGYEVAIASNSSAHQSIHELSGLSQDLAQIEHFFVSYNEMKGKRFEVKGQAGKKRALGLVKAAIKKRRRR